MTFVDVKNKSLPGSSYKIAVQGLLLCFAFLIPGQASAATNLLGNGEFESPLGTTNWTLGYLWGGPADFEIKGRTTQGSRGWYVWVNGVKVTSDFGGHLRPAGNKLAHAYFTQTVSNLMANHAYTVSGYMREDWWSNPTEKAFRDKFLVYIEAIGGQGTAMTDGRASMIATNDLDPDSNIDAPYTYPTDIWREFFTKQKPDTNGTIEIRLHLNKVGFVSYDKLPVMNGYFDSLSLTY
jgi:hypothetical protein